jgi:hypothetical protein
MRDTVANIKSYSYDHCTSALLACCTSFREIPRRIKKQTHAAAVPGHRAGIEQ